MVDLKARIKAKFIRRQPAAPSIASTNNSESLPHPDATSPSDHHHLTSPCARYHPNRDQRKSRNGSDCRPTSGLVDGSDDRAGSYDLLDADVSEASGPSGAACLTSPEAVPTGSVAKLVRPEHAPKLPPTAAASLDLAASSTLSNLDSINEHAQPDVNRPLEDTQREPPVTQAAKLILPADDNDHSSADDIPIAPHPAPKMARKIWVRRDFGGSATLITVREDDLVDEVRETILKKYANSLGRDFDAPDLTLRIVPRDSAASSRKQHSRVLGPEQLMFEVLDTYYPDGQTVDDALVVEISQAAPPLTYKQPTPRLSPGPSTHYQHNSDHRRPDESDPDYFGNVANQPSSRIPHGMTPSPGSSARDRRSANARPGARRAATGSPRDAVGHEPVSKGVGHPNGTQRPAPRPTHSRSHSSISEKTTGGASGTPSGGSTIHHHIQQTSPPSSGAVDHSHISTPPAARPSSPKPKKGKKSRVMDDPPPHPLPSGYDLISASVPPINVLIVEDNKINLSLLGAFVKRLRLRWATAMDGKQAVDKWRTGGFHLVLMDIQLPVMNGLDATREIRRLERANSIGVFTSSASSATVEVADDIPDSDRLPAKELFKSPVIIVALTASSLQSDRHDALAAGCNDFLTKPVNFTWLERKVMEWGCMQALIDFRGWKEWKELSEKNQSAEAAKKAAAQKVKSKRKTNRVKGEGGSEVAAAA